MFSEKLLDHFQNPRNVGELLPPATIVEVSNPACGDILRLSGQIADGRVVEAKYQVRGCTAAIAAGSALTELILQRTIEQLGRMAEEDIEDAVGGLSAEQKHAAVLCRDGARGLAKKLSASR